mmetsp:Transcript_9253/g.23947  ORF Transcript_9253/g.23947 Transcript_9253/m.23947 type:complete len:227 (-) Transcript_9253:396-1076(-)
MGTHPSDSWCCACAGSLASALSRVRLCFPSWSIDSLSSTERCEDRSCSSARRLISPSWSGSTWSYSCSAERKEMVLNTSALTSCPLMESDGERAAPTSSELAIGRSGDVSCEDAGREPAAQARWLCIASMASSMDCAALSAGSWMRSSESDARHSTVAPSTRSRSHTSKTRCSGSSPTKRHMIQAKTKGSRVRDQRARSGLIVGRYRATSCVSTLTSALEPCSSVE